MRVLHLTPELPHRQGGGGGRGHEYLMCRRLVELGHDVLNISPVLPSEACFEPDLRETGVESWVSHRPASAVREVATAVRREPSLLATAVTVPVRVLEMRVFWTELRAVVERACREWRPDVAVIVHGMAAAWAGGLPESMPAVLSLHDLHWRWYASRARLRSGPVAWALRAEALRHRHDLLRQLRRFQAVITLSTIEGEEVRRRCNLPVSVIPTGLDTSMVTAAAEQPVPPTLLFTGTMNYQPNAQGICWFADTVWPLVLASVPEARLMVVGRSPPPAVTALGARPGIEVTGPVKDMAPYFARAHVVVVPILTGAGIRVKIVEAMAAGRPVVSTSLGWAGLPGVEPGLHLLVADTPQAFADETSRLLGDPGLRHRLAAAARLLAEQRYDWRALGSEFEALLTAVAGAGRPGSATAA